MPALATTMTALADKEIFTGLLEQHAGIIRKVAFGYTNTFADREDLTQEITLQLWRAFPRYSSDRLFSTWMYRIAFNVAITFLRRHTHPVRQTVPLEDQEFTDGNAAPGDLRARCLLAPSRQGEIRPKSRRQLGRTECEARRIAARRDRAF